MCDFGGGQASRGGGGGFKARRREKRANRGDLVADATIILIYLSQREREIVQSSIIPLRVYKRSFL